MDTMVYLAEPIDQAEAAQRGTDDLHTWLQSKQLSVYRPRAAWRAASPDPRVDRVNRTALERADLMLAHLPAGVPSIGVPMEIEYAVQRGIPVRVWTSVPSMSLARDGIQSAPTWVEFANLVDRTLIEMRKPAYRAAGEPMPVLTRNALLLPTRTYPDDAGLDLFVSETTEIEPDSFIDVPCGIRVQLPDWSWGMIIGRSSTLRKRGLLVTPAVIDCGWRGELFAGAFNLTPKPVTVEKGDRIAQLVVLDNGTRRVNVRHASRLAPHDRGENGFGSSGQ